MHVIGITGGVGCGKSTVLRFLETKPDTAVVQADEAARALQQPGEAVFAEMVRVFGSGILQPDGTLNRAAVAEIVFHNETAMRRLNAIVHPAVKEEIKRRLACARDQGIRFFFIEAALLIEDHYDEICDEMWYIDTDVQTRRERLKASRGYSDERIAAMLASQRTKEEFAAYCCVVLDNSGAFTDTKEQIEAQLKRFERNGD